MQPVSLVPRDLHHPEIKPHAHKAALPSLSQTPVDFLSIQICLLGIISYTWNQTICGLGLLHLAYVISTSVKSHIYYLFVDICIHLMLLLQRGCVTQTINDTHPQNVELQACLNPCVTAP